MEEPFFQNRNRHCPGAQCPELRAGHRWPNHRRKGPRRHSGDRLSPVDLQRNRRSSRRLRVFSRRRSGCRAGKTADPPGLPYSTRSSPVPRHPHVLFLRPSLRLEYPDLARIPSADVRVGDCRAQALQVAKKADTRAPVSAFLTAYFSPFAVLIEAISIMRRLVHSASSRLKISPSR